MERSFSQRMGFKPLKAIQVHSMDDDLRNGLWNASFDYVRNRFLQRNLWTEVLGQRINEEYASDDLSEEIEELYLKLEWHDVYDFIEYIASSIRNERIFEEDTSGKFISYCNSILEKEMSVYRFIGGKLGQITTDQEIAEIEEALLNANQYTQHLNRALELFSDRKSPDYRNSIKESISAVEAICCLIIGRQKATLGEALSLLESKLGTIHPALREAFKKLYGYTSDAQGIRHALIGESDLDVEDARFMLIACSAFINYLVTKADKAGIKLSQS